MGFGDSGLRDGVCNYVESRILHELFKKGLRIWEFPQMGTLTEDPKLQDPYYKGPKIRYP